MKIALIGASGFVGAAILKEALERGHEVTALVRNPEKITLQSDRLTLKKADVLQDDDAVAALVKGHDAVVSAFNAGWTNPNLYNEYLKGLTNIQQAVKKAEVKRWLVVGGAGSLFVAPGKQLVDTPQFPEAWKSGALAARDYLAALQKEDSLDWTFLSPAIMLQPGEKKGKFRLGTDEPVFDEKGESTITVGDLAVALVDELENGRFIRQRFTVAY